MTERIEDEDGIWEVTTTGRGVTRRVLVEPKKKASTTKAKAKKSTAKKSEKNANND
jgi:hypothetical protein